MTDVGETAGLARILTEGGDARIRLDGRTDLNRYFSAPRPSEGLAYASSTANDISPAAFARVGQVLGEIGAEPSVQVYAQRLDSLRTRIRRAYDLAEDVAVVFAPSGTDLEYVALACGAGRAPDGVHTILLGGDEVGSGCVHSACGHYFVDETALGVAVTPGTPAPGLGGAGVSLVDIPVRDLDGRVRSSAEIAAQMDQQVGAGVAAGRHSLVHVVHGSKTGLILPALDDIDRLLERRGDEATLVVDACQARITSEAVKDYLARGAIVFVTGSKFMGGPPFSGFALAPAAMAEAAPPLPAGLANLFRRAEWGEGWRGAEALSDTVNLGLLLRLEAAVFELERFQRLDPDDVTRVVLAFHAAVRSEIVSRTPARRVAPYPPGHVEDADTHPIEMRTLSTLDLTGLNRDGASLEEAQAWHRAMALAGVRIGQPVKCVRLDDGRWGATVRIGLAMGQIVELAVLPDQDLADTLCADMAAIREALLAAACAPGDCDYAAEALFAPRQVAKHQTA